MSTYSGPSLDPSAPPPKRLLNVYSVFTELVRMSKPPGERDRGWREQGPAGCLKQIGCSQFIVRLRAAGADMSRIEEALRRLEVRENKIALAPERPLGIVSFRQWFIPGAGGVLPQQCHVTIVRQHARANVWVYDYQNRCVATTASHDGSGAAETLDSCIAVLEESERKKMYATVLDAVDGSTEGKRLTWEAMKAQLDHELRERDKIWHANARRVVGELGRATEGAVFDKEKCPSMHASIPHWAHVMHAADTSTDDGEAEAPKKRKRAPELAPERKRPTVSDL